MRHEKKDCVHDKNNVCDLLKTNECSKCSFYKTEHEYNVSQIEQQILEYQKMSSKKENMNKNV
jgi:hypothetical protein